MKTNIGIETTDEEREKIARTLGLKHKLATRNDIKTFVERCIDNLKRGLTDADESEEVERAAEPAPARFDQTEPEAGGDHRVPGHDRNREFVPSRGDEPYLYKPEDPELADACSRILDGLEFIEGYTWSTLERNRQ